MTVPPEPEARATIEPEPEARATIEPEPEARVTIPTGATGPWARTRAAGADLLDRLDDLQQRHPVLAVPVAVVAKWSDDDASRLAGQIAHAAFLAVFPLLLILLTVLELFLSGHPALQRDITDAVLRQFPVLGQDLERNVHQLTGTGGLALALLVLWLLYGATRMSRNAQAMMAVVWGVPRERVPGLLRSFPRGVAFLVVLGLGFLAGGTVAGIGAFGGLGPASAWVGAACTLAVNTAMFWAGFAVLLADPDADRSYWRGALVAAAGWTLLQLAGAQLVNHELRHLTTLYGTFAITIVLIWWIAIGVSITVWAAELDVVLVRRQWPRSLRRTARDAPEGRAAGGPVSGSARRPGRPTGG